MKKSKSTGIIRGIDNLGRVVLPKELRTAMDLTALTARWRSLRRTVPS